MTPRAKTIRQALLAAAILGLPLAWTGAARAQPFEGVYLGGGGGYNWRQTIDTKNRFDGDSGRLRVDDASGYVGLGSLGYGFGNGLRLEVEGNFRQSSVRGITGSSFPAAAGGKINTYGAMANALFDMDTGSPWAYPYIGVGGGYAWTNLHRASLAGITPGDPSLAFDDTQGAPAFQAIAGVSFPVYGVPGLSVTAEYRFFGVFDEDRFKGTQSGAGGATPTTITFRNEYNHSALLGLRYAFGVEPPAPPPVAATPPAAAPTRSYLVFFDWDRATLTERARQIIHEAADNSTKVQYTRIEVNGYTDTSGTPRYNQGLSVRRAQAVAAELVRDGVPRQSITIQGFGETRLLVPTGPGVREPQNRRVEIIIR